MFSICKDVSEANRNKPRRNISLMVSLWIWVIYGCYYVIGTISGVFFILWLFSYRDIETDNEAYDFTYISHPKLMLLRSNEEFEGRRLHIVNNVWLKSFDLRNAEKRYYILTKDEETKLNTYLKRDKICQKK